MVQLDLFAGQEERCRCKEWTCGHGGEGGWDELGDWDDIYTVPCVK